MAAMNMVSAVGFLGVRFHLEHVRRGSPLYFARKPPFFGSRRSKLDHLTVLPRTSMEPRKQYSRKPAGSPSHLLSQPSSAHRHLLAAGLLL